jgi:hypothetical protein
MVMTQMLMRWKPRLGALRDRRKNKTVMTVITEPVGPSGPGAVDDDAEYEEQVEAERRLQARAQQSVHRFVGLSEAAARVLADELNLAIRFFRLGEGLTEDYCAGRVTAQMEDGAVVAARAMH